LPLADGSIDAAVMALVIGFVPDPAKAVAELARAVRPGALVAAYFWDMTDDGTPLAPIDRELRALDMPAMRAPHPEASPVEALRALWRGAGLDAIETRQIPVERIFADFEEFWTASVKGTLLKHQLAAAAPEIVAQLKTNVHKNLPGDAAGRIALTARTNAVKGLVRK
jgi:SAM-dependent methyltransferase